MGWYDPKDANQCIPAGEYEATIKSATKLTKDGDPLVSKAGEPMQKVVFEVYTDAGNRFISQYFTARSMIWMYKRLAQAIGQESQFKAGSFDAEDHIGAGLTLVLEVEENDQYGDQNQIKAFKPLARGGQASAQAKPSPAKSYGASPITDSDVPFHHRRSDLW